MSKKGKKHKKGDLSKNALIAIIIGSLCVAFIIYAYMGGILSFIFNEIFSFHFGIYSLISLIFIVALYFLYRLAKTLKTSWKAGVLIASLIIGFFLVTPVSTIFSSIETVTYSSQVPSEIGVSVQVDKDPVYHTISALFAGGKGQAVTKKCLVRVTRADGQIISAELLPIKLDEVKIPGTYYSDRIEVFVLYYSGHIYKIYDNYLPNRRYY